MINTSFQRLANYKAIINGNCPICNSEIFKGKIISKPSVNKKNNSNCSLIITN
jgi:hypothetical protein